MNKDNELVVRVGEGNRTLYLLARNQTLSPQHNLSLLSLFLMWLNRRTWSLPLCFSSLSLALCSYLKEFGFTIPDRAIMVDDIRVRGSGKSGIQSVVKAKMGDGKAKPVTVHEHTQSVNSQKYMYLQISKLYQLLMNKTRKMSTY